MTLLLLLCCLVIGTMGISSLRGCSVAFQWSPRVFHDDVCFPIKQTFFLSAGERRTMQTAKERSSLDLIRTQHWKLQEDTHQMEIDPAIVKTFENAFVYRNGDTTFLRGNSYWTACERCLYMVQTTPRLPIRTEVDVYMEEAILMSSQIWGGGYFHYMTEKAFPLGAVRSILESNPNTMIIVEQAPSPYIEFIRDILGLSPDRLHVISNQNIQVTRLHMVYFFQCGFAGSANQHFIRKWVRDRHPFSEKASSIVVLDRSEDGQCNRCLLNSNELVKRLAVLHPTRNVILFRAGETSVQSQMKLFASCELLIAPHGAGLTNMLYMQNGGKILEVQNHPNYYHYGYYDMAIGFGLIYRGIGPLQTGLDTVDYNQYDIPRTIRVVNELLTHF